MNRILEAFTRPRYEVTAIDEFIMGVVILGAVLFVLIVVAYVADKIK